MILTCGACGATASLEVWMADVEARGAIATLLALPPGVVRFVPGYLGLFRPVGQVLPWSVVQRLAGGLRDLVASGEVTLAKGSRRCPHELWGRAIEQILAQREGLKLPLTNHNYLVSIAWSKADEAEAVEERRREELLRSEAGRQEVEQAKTAEQQRVSPAESGAMGEARRLALAICKDGEPTPIWEIVQRLLDGQEVAGRKLETRNNE